MYRLAIYYLASIVLLAGALSASGFLPYNPWHILLSAAYLVVVCLVLNEICSRLIDTRANAESAIITGLILSLIVGPWGLIQNVATLSFLAFAAMVSKYLLVWHGKHIFNPAAAAVLISAVLINQGASWWVGSVYLAPIVIIFGFILAKKVARTKMIISFLLVYFILISFTNWTNLGPGGIASLVHYLALASPVMFFAFVMLPEPQTSPKGDKSKIVYGSLTAAALFLYQNYIPAGYTLELALLTGNFFAFAIAHDVRTGLVLKSSEQLGAHIFGFWFEPKKKINFNPGQFLEWTLYHPRADSRGIRRYFTIASSPTEDKILLTAKFPEQPSSFKSQLSKLNLGETAIATGAEGEFLLPKNGTEKMVFIAGGIGITPFRSQIRYLLDKNETRDMVLFYSVNSPDEIAFKDVFDEAKSKIGLKIVYTISEKINVPQNWDGESGFIDESMIKRHVPDWQDRTFYVSGPEPMVRIMCDKLIRMGIAKFKIKRDYFPGYEEI